MIFLWREPFVGYFIFLRDCMKAYTVCDTCSATGKPCLIMCWIPQWCNLKSWEALSIDFGAIVNGETFIKCFQERFFFYCAVTLPFFTECYEEVRWHFPPVVTYAPFLTTSVIFLCKENLVKDGGIKINYSCTIPFDGRTMSLPSENIYTLITHTAPFCDLDFW